MAAAAPFGYVATTDPDWYRHLLAKWTERRRLDEVNFWQPGGSRDFRAVEPGAPFFFKLKRPHDAIGGFGFFARASRIPVSLAWDAFGDANGMPSQEALLSRIARLRPGGGGGPAFDPTIGCLMISEPVFFEESDWVRVPADWRRNIVSGKRYSLVEGEGARLWRECLERSGRRIDDVEGPLLVGDHPHGGARRGAPAIVRPRLGQGTFRVAVTDSYGRACAVTGEHSLPVLDAAHIRPFADDGPHVVSNGLCLRTDVHRLFDRGFVTVDPEYRFRVSPRLREEWRNGRAYYALDGKPIALPRSRSEWPDPGLLAWHGRERFRASV